MRLLRLRDFRLVFFSLGLSSLGDYLALIALTLQVKDLTESGWAISSLLLAGLVPMVVLSPVAGWLVDRFETVRVLTIAALAQTALALGLVVADSFPAIVILFFLLSAGVAVSQPALFALIPRAVGEQRTTEANASLEIARWGGAALGPLVAGSLSGAFGPDAALLANAGTFALVALAIPLLRVRRPPEPVAEPEGRRREMRQGAVFLLRNRLLLLVVGALAGMIVFAAIDNVAEVFFAKDVLDAGDAGYGALITAWTLGMVAGATGIGRRLQDRYLAPTVLAAAVVGGAAIALAATFPTLPFALVTFFVGGMANGVEVVGMRSLIHRRTPDRLRGRVFAASSATLSTAQIAAMGLGGALVSGIGPRGSLLLGGIGSMIVGGLGLLAYTRLGAGERAAGRGDVAPADEAPTAPPTRRPPA